MLEHDAISIPAPPFTPQRDATNADALVSFALGSHERGEDVVAFSQAPLGEILAARHAECLDGIAACLLDCADVARVERLIARGHEALLGQALPDRAAWLRLHAWSPRWAHEFIQDGSPPDRCWDRWTSWDRGDPRWDIHVIDTTHLSIEDVASGLAAWMTDTRDRYEQGSLPLARGWAT